MKSLLRHGFFCSCVEIKNAEPGDVFKPGPPQCKKIKCHKVIIKAIKSWLNEHSMDVPSGREQISWSSAGWTGYTSFEKQ